MDCPIEDEAWTLLDEPCPHCGEITFYEKREKRVESNGYGFRTDSSGETVAVCRACDSKLFVNDG